MYATTKPVLMWSNFSVTIADEVLMTAA